MSAKHRFLRLPSVLENYAEERGIEYHRYSPFHMRLIYTYEAEPRVMLDTWTTRKYWIKETNYYHNLTERGGETGFLPERTKELYIWLDKLFFAVEMAEEKHSK